MNMKKKTSELYKSAFTQMMKDVATSTVGHIVAFDPVTQLAQVQIGIVKVATTGETFDPAIIVECPVYFAGGSSFMMEHQIDPNDECVILFSQRCIDGWRETGGVAQQPIIRYHDINDAMCLPGIRSKPNTIVNFQNDGIRLRNADATAYVWLKGDGSIHIKGSGGLFINDEPYDVHTHEAGTYSNSGGTVTGSSGGVV